MSVKGKRREHKKLLPIYEIVWMIQAKKQELELPGGGDVLPHLSDLSNWNTVGVPVTELSVVPMVYELRSLVEVSTTLLIVHMMHLLHIIVPRRMFLVCRSTLVQFLGGIWVGRYLDIHHKGCFGRSSKSSPCHGRR